MIRIAIFTFNSFQENTYVLYDETKECIIIDPGCHTTEEQSELSHFIEQEGLKPVKLLNTHCHVDHVFGNKFVSQKYNIGLEMHKDDLQLLRAVKEYSAAWGMSVESSPDPVTFLEEGTKVYFGNSELRVFHTPGHSPGGIVFYCKDDRFVIAGDVLFLGSIGRTDLPGGDFETLINSIRDKLFCMDDEVKVYSGHGPSTTIGYEKKHNPFLA